MFCFLKASTTKGSKSPAKVGEGGSSSMDFKMVSSGLTENQLQLSVEVSLSFSYLLQLKKRGRHLSSQVRAYYFYILPRC